MQAGARAPAPPTVGPVPADVAVPGVTVPASLPAPPAPHPSP